VRPVRPLVGAEEGPGEEKGVTVEEKGPEPRRERRRCQAREGRKRRGGEGARDAAAASEDEWERGRVSVWWPFIYVTINMSRWFRDGRLR
jgi:hypothetical protein